MPLVLSSSWCLVQSEAHGHYLAETLLLFIQSCPTVCNPLDCSMPGFRLSPSPRACSNSYPSSWLSHPTISSSVVPFASCLQSSPASGSILMSRLLEPGGQSIGASASVLLMNTQDWFPLGWTDWISLQSKGLSRVFSNTTVQKHQLFAETHGTKSVKCQLFPSMLCISNNTSKCSVFTCFLVFLSYQKDLVHLCKPRM